MADVNLGNAAYDNYLVIGQTLAMTCVKRYLPLSAYHQYPHTVPTARTM